QLEPLDREIVGCYVAHRLTIAGGAAVVTFAPKALHLLHRLSGGIPRLINLICDRALLAAFSVRENRITPDMVTHAAESLEVRALPRVRFPRLGASLAGAAAVTIVASAIAVGSATYLYQRFADQTVQAAGGPSSAALPRDRQGLDRNPSAAGVSAVNRDVPSGARLTILVGAYPIASASAERDIRALTERLETSGYDVYYAEMNLGPKGRWQRVLAGAYTDLHIARREADR